ncbi:putative ribonuclease H-like domain-containing protein [Tanacetum coccineum]
METIPDKDYILLPMWPADLLFSQNLKDSPDARFKPSREEEKKDAQDPGNKSGNPTEGKDSEVPSIEEPRINQVKDDNINNTNNINTAINAVDPKTSIELPNDPNMPELAEPKKVIQALKDPSWIEAMQDELLQFKLQKVWTLVDLPNGKRAIGYTQEGGNNYDEVFAPVARIKAIRLFLACASFKDFVVYQIDVKSAFLYGKIEKEVYVCQPPGFEDPDFSNRVYKVEKALYGLHQAPRACTGLQVKQKEDEIFISQDKYVTEILKKFGFSDIKTASTPMETHKPLLKDADGEDINEHIYRSMIGLLMYLTSSRPDINV